MRLFFRLILLFRPYAPHLLLGVFLAALTQLGNIALMATSGWFIAAMGLAGLSGASINYFLPAVLIRAFAIIRTAGRYAERLVGHDATLRVIALLRSWLFSRIEPLSPEIIQRLHSGEIEGSLREDLDRLETVYLRQLAPIAVAAIVALLVACWFFRHSPAFAAAFLACLLGAGFVFPLLLVKQAHRLGRIGARLSHRLSILSIDAVQGMPELLAFGAEQSHMAAFNRAGDRLIRIQLLESRLSGAMAAMVLLAANLALWAMIVIAAPMVEAGRLAPPDLAMIALAALAAFEAVAPLPNSFLAAGWVAESARRVFALADLPPPPSSGAPLLPCPETPVISAKDLCFRYQNSEKQALAPVSFELAPGSRLGIVGRTGSGKSTLLLLLAGLLPPGAGRLLIDGRDAADYDPDSIRRLFSFAPQNPSLLSGSIRDCLRLGAPNASDQDIMEALKIVRLDRFVAALPDGLGAWVGEAGYNLSGGQAKRLSIARALLRPAPFLVLDEPGENLDYATEREMIENILSSLGKRGLILVTHRPTGLDAMDGIVRL